MTYDGGRWSRFVALGDSQTEGLADGDERTGYRGWADRLAEQMARSQPGAVYANLAVRGRRAAEVRSEQLPAALALRPTVAAVSAGVNDVLRTGFDARAVADELDAMFVALRAIDCVVVTMTFPRLAHPVPGGAAIGRRITALNHEIRRVAARSDVAVIDLALHDVASDPRLWSRDRLHLNSTGHRRLADAAADVLGVPDSDDAWVVPLPPMPRSSLRERVAADTRWTVTFLLPWLLRRVRGRSSGDRRTAKRPQLASV
ncbi:SGNH/GDSL hydrolase family protein [uncultured Williamsia sp.]|uniref:SGNH/GDSL hydrolase family protein n=1 Tax=uncultured Williamsia sp. TaxID=259311 RepID=UPI002632B221|nr:SGNH/GDSL hydrolase family protein [uncultured Williamsia sp.]